MYTCFKFRFSTLKWKSAIIGRVNGTSGRVYNMQHTKYNAPDGAKNELIYRTVVCRAPGAFNKWIIDWINDRSTKTLTIRIIAAADHSQVKMLPYFHVYNIHTIFDWHYARISLYYNCSWEREHIGRWIQVLENKKKCLTHYWKWFKIVSVKGTW